MNARKMFARIVAGRVLDRINKINRILAWRTGETGGRLGLPPQTPPKADLNAPASPALPA